MLANPESVMPGGLVRCIRFMLNFFGILFSSHYAAALEPVDLADEGHPLSRRSGYVILHLDIEGPAPQLSIVSVAKNGRFGREKKVSLPSGSNDLVLFSAGAGEYQITRVAVPYFDLPYQVNVANDYLWRFKVERSKTNYIGRLVVSKERSRNAVNIKLLNRLSEDLPTIQAAFGRILANHPLVPGYNYRDDFLKVMSEAK